MTLKEVRDMTNMSQSEFSEYTGLSLRRVQSWEQGFRKEDPCIVELVYRLLKAEGILKED